MRWLLLLLLLAAMVRPGWARPGVPVQVSLDYDVTLDSGVSVQGFQIQACQVATCSETCTPTDLTDALVPRGIV